MAWIPPKKPSEGALYVEHFTIEPGDRLLGYIGKNNSSRTVGAPDEVFEIESTDPLGCPWQRHVQILGRFPSSTGGAP